MNKKIFLLVIIMIPLFSCSCSKKALNLPSETINSIENSSASNQEAELPANYTIDKVKNALLEYINYRLYFYPAKIMDVALDKDFDNYIGKSIDVEIRIYYDGSKKSVYAHTSVGDWLAIFKNENELVYCEGQVSEGEGYGWPNDAENYKVIEKYSVIIPEPRKPNYGTSERKDKMIAAFEAKIKAACLDFYKGAYEYYTEWENVDVYIVDFYEYQMGAQAWLCKQDGSITNYPVDFEENNNEFKVQSVKGYTMKNKDAFTEFGRFQFERNINDAVKHFKCNVK